VLSSRDWEALKTTFEQNTYYAGDLTWNGLTVRNVGIRSRGSATRSGVKPGLRIDINRYVSNQEFLGLKAVVLDNMLSDSSLVRESVTMKMFAKMGIPASRETHARLYVNNEYVGAYVLSEAIDRTFVSRVFGAEEAQVESGGYLFEYEYRFPYHFEYLGPDLEAYAAMFKPETRETDSIVNIYGPIEDMIRTINESPDNQFADAVSKVVEMPQLMRYLAVETCMVEWDGLVGFVAMNNFHLYRSRQTGRAQFIPKDKDASLAFMDIPITFRLDTNVLTRRAMQVPEFRQVYLDALSQCANLAQEPGADDARGWLEREVDRQTAQIADAVAEDPGYPYSYDEFQSVGESLLEFARARPPFVSCEATERTEEFDRDTDCAIVTDTAAATGRIFALGSSRRKR
jgi:spore coat protein CotH